MQEQAKEIFTKSALFESAGQKITVTISFENCTKKDHKTLNSVVKTIFEDLMTTVENSFSRAD